MSLIKRSHRVRRWTHQDFTGHQDLEVVFSILGFVFWWRTIDTEYVPSYVSIELGCLGYTTWESRIMKQHADKLGENPMTDTDKEMLTMAAKAAGIKVIRSRLDDPMHRDFLVKGGARNQGQDAGPWNPLTDDGDALRLEITLKLDVQWGVLSQTWGIYRVADGFYQELARDPDRKRATTMAAAELGRKLHDNL